MNEKDFETVMEAVCDICHWPFVEKSEEALNVHCEDCPVEKILKTVGLDRSEPRPVSESLHAYARRWPRCLKKRSNAN